MASVIRVDNIQGTNGANYMVNGYNQRPGQIIEYLSGPCDGSTLVGASGTYTWPSVTTQQGDSSYTYADLTGSSINYTPPAGASRVVYKFEWSAYWVDAHAIAHFRLYIGGNEVIYARHTRAGYYHETKIPFEWTFHIGGTDNLNTGRQAIWNTSKNIKLQYRSYGSSDRLFLHGTTYWDGAGGNQFSMPQLTIQAIA